MLVLKLYLYPMLKNLHIKNYAIIEEIEMNFSSQLNIITGETGAGKSILTGALGLIQGNRADTKVLYDKEQKCIVEAEFVSHDSTIQGILQDEEIESDEYITIRRMIAPSGKSRAFINDEPVKLSVLKSISGRLVDMHRQFDTQGINKEDVQFSMLDSLADVDSIRDKYVEAFAQFKKDKSELKALIEEEAKVNQELDFIEFQLNELSEFSFEKGEQAGLEQEVNLLSNAENIVQALQKINFQLDTSEVNIIRQLTELRNELERAGEAGENIQALNDRLMAVTEDLRDIAATSSQLEGSIDGDPATLQEKQERLDTMYRLIGKHHKENLDELVDYQEELSNKLFKLKSYGKDRSQLEERIAKTEKELEGLAKKWRAKREKVTPSFEKKIMELLGSLGMEHAQFKVLLADASELRGNGSDNLRFMFSANPGKEIQSLNEVASGGELSRLALSLKSIIAGKVELGTLIFDEIDTGISGEVSSKMGRILQSLSKSQQIISITHSPQIASRAESHFFIYKVVENNRTYTKIRTLDEEGKVQELAKMLSGDPPPESAVENARVLLKA